MRNASPGWSGDDRPAAVAEATLPELFEQVVGRLPDEVAVVAGDRRLTYAELNGRANRLAHTLVGLGVRVEDRVAVALARGVDLVVAALAAVKAGAAPVLMDVGYPDERIRYLMRDACPRVLVSGGRWAPPARCPTVLVDAPDTAARLAAAPATDPVDADRPAALRPDNVAYVVYTSGSTGRPKGVLVTHRGIPALVASQRDHFGLGPGSRVLQYASPGFDAYVWELCMALLSGGTLVLADPAELLPGPALTRLVARHGVTHMTMPPTALAAMPPGERLPAATTVIVAGEECGQGVVRRWADGRRLVNAYGPSEATVCVTISDPLPDGPTPSIGRPIRDAGVYLLDDRLARVPPGTAGELYLAGPCLARGYLDQPALTAERFLPDPYGPPGSRMYRTGDLGQWRPEGTVEFVGRADGQISLRGYRIEPGEIEAALLDHPDVQQAVALAREDRPGHRRLVAYVVARRDRRADPGGLRRHLATKLPGHLVPAHVVIVDRFPKTPNGKLDRVALPPPTGPRTALDAGDGPADARERILTALFAEVLGLPAVAPGDTFMELGGDSILAIRLASRARAAGLALAPADVLIMTVRQLAAAATRVSPEPGGGAAPTGDGEELALTPLQHGLLFHAGYDTAGPDVYVMQVAYDLTGPLDPAILRRAADAVLRRHPNLAASFRHRDGAEPVQLVPAGPAAPWRELLVEGDAELGAVAAAERATRFDLAHGPALRFMLVRTGPSRHRLLLTLHHVLADGWSMSVLARELFAAYARGGTLPAPAGARFGDFLRWLAAQDPVAARAAWAAEFEGFDEPTRMAPDRPDRAAPWPDHVAVELPEDLTATLTGAAGRSAVTVATVLQLAWGIVLGRLTGRRDVAFGLTVAGRPHQLAGVEHMAGLFVNTVPVRVRVRGGETLGQAAARLQRARAALAGHEHLGLADIQAEIGLGELFDTAMMVESYPDEGELSAGAGVTVRRAEVFSATHYPLSLCATPGGRLRLRLDYHGDLFDRPAVRAMLERLVRVLRTYAVGPSTLVSSVDVLSPQERRRVLSDFNDTARPVPAATLPALFERVARRSPERVAARWDGGEIKYGQLNRRANRLAHGLIRRGVRTEDVVAVALPRGADLLAAILGAQKAGAAVLPLDPSHPSERIRYVLADARPAVLVTDGSVASPGDRNVLEPAASPGDWTVVEPAASPGDWTVVEPAASPGEWTVVEPAADPADDHDPTDRDRPLPLGPDNAAYVIYTSGSTGRPKGVVVTHAGIPSLAATEREHLGVTPESRVLQFFAPVFDVFFAELCLALLSGATLVLADPDDLQPGGRLTGVIAEHGVTHAMLPPAALAVLPDTETLPDGMTILLGGEPPAPGVIERWSPGRTMFNSYGPTETTICVTISGPLPYGPAAPVGRPIANTRAYVLDPDLRPVAPGTPGELYLAGPCLARGYLGQPALTAQRFMPDPFGPAGGRLYRTGDLVRWRANGNLEFLGRTDHQIKLRGFRIELGEIEHRLTEHPDVGQAVALIRTDRRDQPRLAAYVVPQPGRRPDPDALRADMARVLPGYMVPAEVVLLDRIPLTRNGKLDRAALPAPGQPGGSSGRDDPPRTPNEHTLARLFADALGRPSVGIHDGFFDLGGTSLLATGLIHRIRSTWGTQMGIRALFDHPTVAALAQRLWSGPAEDEFDVLLPLQRGTAGVPLFCVHPASGLSWPYLRLIRHVGPDRPLYGLQARTLRPGAPRPAGIDEMAADYLQQIRAVQPHGPYRLLGYSFGGNVAHAMACQLTAAGERVSLLVLLDAYPPETVCAPDDNPDLVLATIREQAGGLPEPVLAAVLDTHAHCVALRDGHTTGHHPGDAVLVTSTTPGAPGADGWRRHIGGTVTVHHVDAPHEYLLHGTALDTIGPVLLDALRRADQAAAGPMPDP